MRVLLSTHSAATRTSFGIVCREIFSRIRAADPSIEIFQHGWYHHPVTEEVDWEIIPTGCIRTDAPDGVTPPDLGDGYGDNSFAAVVERTRPDLVWHLGDPYMGIEPARRKHDLGYRFLYYYPVGREPLNHFREEWVEKLSAADDLVAVTRYGAEILAAVPGLERPEIPHIPHGVDTAAFRPRPAEERAALREGIGGGRITGDTFVLGWVGHDQYRKQVWTLFELLYYLRSGHWIRCRRCDRITVMEFDPVRRRPQVSRRLRTYTPGYDYRTCWYCGADGVEEGEPREDVVLWTVMGMNLEAGWDLRLLVDYYGLHDVVFDSLVSRGETGHTTSEMSEVYACFDALVFPSGAEGFGMPVLEAMACGVPVVHGRYSAHAEFAVGLPVRVRLVPDHPDPSFLGYVDPGDLLRNVLRLLDEPDLRADLSAKGVAAAREMDWDVFTPRWLELLG